MKKIYAMSLLVLVLFLGACSQGNSNDSNGNNENDVVEVKVLKVGTADAESRPTAQAMYKFQEIIEAESNGSIKVEVYHSAQMGGDRELFEAMQIGSIEAAAMSTGPIAAFAPRVAVFDLPFIFPNKEVAHDVLDGPIGDEVFEELIPQGVVGLAYWENGVRHLTNNIKPVYSVEDLAGLDIRTMESQIHLDLWSQLGANPTPMAWPEVFAGLQQGVIDAQENPAGNVVSNKLYEVQKYFSKTNHVYSANMFMVSEIFWNTLNDEEKEIVRKAAVEARDFQRQLSHQEEEDSYAIILEEGMEINELTEEEAAKFFEKTRPVYDKYSSEIGEELINKVVEAARP